MTRTLIVSHNDDLNFRSLQCLAVAGLKAFVATSNAGSSRCRRFRSCIEVMQLPAHLEKHEWILYFCELRDRLGLTHIVPTDIAQSLLLAEIGSQLAPLKVFPLSSPDTLQLLNDKFRFSCELERLGLPTPRFTLLQSATDVARHSLGEKVVVKPLSAEGGVGVHMCKTAAELAEVIANDESFPAAPLLLQEFIPGEDIDVSVLASHGKILRWTVQQRASRHQQSLGSVKFLRHDKALQLVTDLVAGVKFHGVGHIDMRMDNRDGSVKFIEFNPRIYGSIQFSAYAGINFIDAGLKLCSGTSLKPQAGHVTGVANTPRALFHLLLHNDESIERFTPATFCALRQAALDPLAWGARILRL